MNTKRVSVIKTIAGGVLTSLEKTNKGMKEKRAERKIEGQFVEGKPGRGGRGEKAGGVRNYGRSMERKE